MADFIRPNILTLNILTLVSCLLLLLAHVSDVSASPLSATLVHSGASGVDLAVHHWKRATPIVVTSDSGTNTSVLDPGTRQAIAQGAGTDGGGDGFSLPAILWLAFVFVIGVPLAFAGIRLWRVTIGLGIGLSCTLLLWAAFVNTISADGLSDIIITVIAVGGFAVGFVFGLLDFSRWAGILVLGTLGGCSIGVRIVLLRPGLLTTPSYLANWIVIVVFMIIGLASVLVRQRFGLVSSCAAIGTFLIGLGVDLIIEKQAGLSFGLRFLLDRNDSHFMAIVHKGYNPSLVTQILLGVSIGLIPLLAYAQHKIFKGPFRPVSSQAESDMASLMEKEPGWGIPEEKPQSRSAKTLLKSRFSLS